MTWKLSSEDVWYYVGTTTDWFEANTSESRLAKYWASEEMAKTVMFEHFYLQEGFDVVYSHLAQLLKKEWFR